MVAASLVFVNGCAFGLRAPAVAKDKSVPKPRAEVMRDSMRAVLERAVQDGAFPGAYAVIGTANGAIAEVGVGHLDSLDRQVPNAKTIWDMASLTKVLGTTSAVMQLVAQERIALDTPVVRYLPEWKAEGVNVITVRQLLTHSAGLPAWRPLYKEAGDSREAWDIIFATKPDTLPNIRYVYSDLGFILLGRLVQQMSGATLAEYDVTHIFAPLGMKDTRYLPPSSWRKRTAPTEIDPWRGRHIRGEVHDENAARLDGVSGHAGLFSSGRDLVRFAQMYLGHGRLNGHQVLDSTTMARFLQVQDTGISKRALGWETPTGGNSAGHRMSPMAFGHTGFTGTSVWIDPGNGLFVILLTNRVNPTRENRKIGAVRVELADVALDTWQRTAGAGR